MHTILKKVCLSKDWTASSVKVTGSCPSHSSPYTSGVWTWEEPRPFDLHCVRTSTGHRTQDTASARGLPSARARRCDRASHPPLLQVMAGLGAPDTSHLSVAVIPSVTVVSTGS